MTKHKFLEDIGINSYPENNYGSCHSLKGWFRHLRYKHIRKKTGVDPRDCWDLDVSFYQWLYERLMQYKQDAEKYVDLEYNKFTFKDKENTQKELINRLCDDLKEMLFWDDFKGCPDPGTPEWEDNPDGTRSLVHKDFDEQKAAFHKQVEENDKKKEALKLEIFTLWRMLIDVMWW